MFNWKELFKKLGKIRINFIRKINKKDKIYNIFSIFFNFYKCLIEVFIIMYY